ncbi:MAG: 3-mercaptopyruvate sulfurtransferase [Granulosicoccus sp.]
MKTDKENVRLPIVSCEWLQAHLLNDNVRVVDASLHLPATGRNARVEFNRAHIPRAVFFDIEEHSAPGELPHMLPDAAQFADAAGALGIAAHHEIVIYDSVGLYSAARVWWMFRHFGADKVFVLDGGLPAWKQSGGELCAVPAADAATSGTSSTCYAPCEFAPVPGFVPRQVVNAEEVLASIDDPGTVILDARSAGRFSAEVKEARAGLRSGHIPGSLCVPFTHMLDEKHRLKSISELAALFEELKLDKQVRVVTTCGSGVTAAVLVLALECVGYTNVALYDGSWSEWGALEQVPVATGA